MVGFASGLSVKTVGEQLVELLAKTEELIPFLCFHPSQ